MKRLLYISLIIPLLWSCRPKDLEISVPAIEPKVVVASQVIPGQVMVIGLTRSFGALEEGSGSDVDVTDDLLDRLLVDGGWATITYQGQTNQLFQVEKGVYASISTPQYTNEPYTLTAYDPQTMDTVVATAYMLERVNYDTIYPIKGVNNSGDSIIDLEIAFQDPPGENWYMVNVYKNQTSDSASFDLTSYFNRGDNLLLNTFLLSDAQFNGSMHQTSLRVDGADMNDSIAVSLSNISREYFEYLNLRQQSQNWFSEITNEPINYPTNVRNGLGFFNTHYPSVQLFNLSQW